MPVLAPVFAAIGAEVIGGAILGTAAGAAIGSGVAMAIGGAIGGALGGGLNSVMQGGSFWDGAKGGAIGGAIGGGITGAGGFEGIMDSISGAASGAETAIPYVADAPTGFEQTLAQTINPTDVVQADKFALPSLADTTGGSLISPELDPGAIAGSAPKFAQNLGGTNAVQAMGSAGSQNTLANLFKPLEGKNPYELAGRATGYFNAGQETRNLKEGLAGIRSRGTGLMDLKTSAYNSAADRSTSVQGRVDALFAKYGIGK